MNKSCKNKIKMNFELVDKEEKDKKIKLNPYLYRTAESIK
jgi:hypothetical protein